MSRLFHPLSEPFLLRLELIRLPDPHANQLVWRVSRLGAVERESNPHYRVEPEVINIFNLLNVRLEAVRTRHEQLEPAGNLTSDDAFFRPKRSTICSTRGVKEAPWASEDGGDDALTVHDRVPATISAPEADGSKPERLAQPVSIPDKLTDQTAVSKMVSWLKGGRKQKGARAERPKPLSLPTKNGTSPEQHWPSVALPTRVETGDVQPAANGAARSKNLSPPTFDADLVRRSSSASSSKSEKRKSRGSAFFAFEFENGVVSRADVDPNLLSPSASESGGPGSPPTAGSTSPTRPQHPDRGAALSPRVSIRFSKRSSILPPAAIDLLKSTGIEDVPPIPERFRRTVEIGYDKRLHPYAVRGLRDYEDALDEWTDWVARLQEEEELAPCAFDIVRWLSLRSLPTLARADSSFLPSGTTPCGQLAAQLGGKLMRSSLGATSDLYTSSWSHVDTSAGIASVFAIDFGQDPANSTV